MIPTHTVSQASTGRWHVSNAASTGRWHVSNAALTGRWHVSNAASTGRWHVSNAASTGRWHVSNADRIRLCIWLEAELFWLPPRNLHDPPGRQRVFWVLDLRSHSSHDSWAHPFLQENLACKHREEVPVVRCFKKKKTTKNKNWLTFEPEWTHLTAVWGKRAPFTTQGSTNLCLNNNSLNFNKRSKLGVKHQATYLLTQDHSFQDSKSDLIHTHLELSACGACTSATSQLRCQHYCHCHDYNINPFTATLAALHA